MLKNLAVVGKRQRSFARAFSSANIPKVRQPEAQLFPNEYEGNIYDHNWSLIGDQVIPEGLAFRNARTDLLKTRVSIKKGDNILQADSPSYDGKFNVAESGDSLSQIEFADLLKESRDFLSSGADIFFEDAILGSYSKQRLGIRVMTLDAKMALIARTLLIPSPPYDVDLKARFDGWNKDPRWDTETAEWDGEKYDLATRGQRPPMKGQRPIGVFVGGKSSNAAVEFIETDGSIVGANVVVGSAAPVAAFIEAVGLASDVVINEKFTDALALPSISFSSAKGSVVVVNADQSFTDAIVEKADLHGAYNNILSKAGVSAMWNGVVGSSKSTKFKYIPSVVGSNTTEIPTVSVANKAALPVQPNNIIAPAKAIVFYEKGGSRNKLSKEDGIKRIHALVGDVSEGKAAAIKEIVSGVEFYVVGSAADALKL